MSAITPLDRDRSGHSSLRLEQLAACFQGLIPATLATASSTGVPNVAYLSHVDYVDSRHVALSFQFFNKSRRNILENPHALIRVHDPDTMQGYLLELRYVRSETAGPTFDAMALRIEAIASYSGLKGVFRLLAADIYEVLSIEETTDELGCCDGVGGGEHPAADEALFTVTALQQISERLRRSASLEEVLDSVLAALEEVFGFDHSMVLLAGEQEGKVVTVASRGYPENGAGAEVGFGEGIIGMVAEARKPIRISGLLRGMLYALAVGRRAEEEGQSAAQRRIPLPGLASPQSQLGIPLLVRDELIGVLYIESEVPYRFHEEDRICVELLGSFVAIAIQNALLQERLEDEDEEPGARHCEPTRRDAAAAGVRHEVCFYRADECILVDGNYLIRSLPARLLWKILDEHASTGRVEFSNRELRLDKSLQLPAFKDNLETRLLLLRRRLEERCPDILLVPTGRGRFALELSCALDLEERP